MSDVTATQEIYKQVMQEVINGVRDEFLAAGYEQSELNSLKSLWERKLMQSVNAASAGLGAGLLNPVSAHTLGLTGPLGLGGGVGGVSLGGLGGGLGGGGVSLGGGLGGGVSLGGGGPGFMTYNPAHKLNAQLSAFPMGTAIMNVGDLGTSPNFGQPVMGSYDGFRGQMGMPGLSGDMLQRHPVLISRSLTEQPGSWNQTLVDGSSMVIQVGRDGAQLQQILQMQQPLGQPVPQLGQPVTQLGQPAQLLQPAQQQSRSRPQHPIQGQQPQQFQQQFQQVQSQPPQLQQRQQQLVQQQPMQQQPLQQQPLQQQPVQQQPVQQQPAQQTPKQSIPVSTPQNKSTPSPPQGRVAQMPTPKPSTPSPKPQSSAKKSGRGMAWDALKAQQNTKWKNKETATQQQPEQQEELQSDAFLKIEPHVAPEVQPQVSSSNEPDGDSDKESEAEELSDRSSEESEDLETDNLVVCTFENKSRVKNRWKVALKSGVMTINGKDYLFNRATLEGEW